MALTKFVNFFAVVSFAVFFISLTPIAANALAVERAHVARNLNYAHAGIARKKQDEKRCKPRPSTSTPSTHKSTATPSEHSSPSTHNPPSHSTSSSSPKPPSHPTTSSPHPPAATTDGFPRAIVGLGWSNHKQPNLCHFTSKYTKLVFNWQIGGYPDMQVSKCPGLQYLPMVWGEAMAHDVPRTLVKGYANMVAMFNEPELPSQSHLSVDRAIELYWQYIHPLKHLGYKIGSPACTNSPQGVAWIKSFVKRVRASGGQLDFICTHVYTTSVNVFIQFMTDFQNLFPNDDIYVLEFNAQDFSGSGHQLNLAEIHDFMARTTRWMQHQEHIKLYSWFGLMEAWEARNNSVNGLNAMMGANGLPNALGLQYLNP